MYHHGRMLLKQLHGQLDVKAAQSVTAADKVEDAARSWKLSV